MQYILTVEGTGEWESGSEGGRNSTRGRKRKGGKWDS